MDITQKIDAVTKIGQDRISMGGIQPPPKSVKIELTSKCNLRCKFCAVRTREKQSNQEMPFEVFKQITKDMRISGVEEIGLFYLGESFMAFDLLHRAVHWCKSLGFPWVFLTTNGTLATPGKTKKLMELGLDSLKWSVNSADDEQFQDITQSTPVLMHEAFKNIRQTFQLRNSMGYKTILSASSILYEGSQGIKMQSTIDQYVKPYVDKHYWLPLYQMSMYKKELEQTLGYSPTAGNMGRIDEATGQPNRKPLPCWSAFTEGHVRVDGGLSACCFGADDKFDMGILNGSNFMTQWNSDKFQKLRIAQLKTLTDGPDALRNTVCEVCVAHGEQV